MAIEVVMPRLGWTMETGTVAEWLKKDGDAVRVGEAIFTVDSDKAVQEIEALDSGILRIPPDAPPVGASVPVGSVLAYLVAPGETAIPTPGETAIPTPGETAIPTPGETAIPTPGESDGRATTDEERAPGPDPELGLDVPAKPTVVVDDGPASRDASVTPTAAVSNGRVSDMAGMAGAAASPRARRVAGELGVDWAAATGTGRTGRIVERDVRALAEQAPLMARARVTPLARRLAEDTGVDLAALETGKPGQRIARADVEVAARDGGDGRDGREEQTGAAEPALSHDHRAPLSHIRRITAQRMAQSAHTTAPVTLTTDADVTELVAVRTRIKAALAGSGLRVPTYNDLLTRLVALALLQQPWMNCSLEDDAIVRHEGVHMGIAVDTERGLFVPVIRDAHLKSIQQIATDAARLIDATRAGRADADDLRGGTFTISNLGMYEIDAFTPIINLPECAILGVGRIVARPVVIDEESGEVVVRKMMALSLTFDHRLVDGAPAARFLQHVKRWIEQPYAWLTR